MVQCLYIYCTYGLVWDSHCMIIFFLLLLNIKFINIGKIISFTTSVIFL